MVTTQFWALLAVTAVVATFASPVVDTTLRNVTTQIKPDDDHTATYETGDFTSTYETDDYTSTHETTSVDFTDHYNGKEKDVLTTRKVGREQGGTNRPTFYNQTRLSRRKRFALFDHVINLQAGKDLFDGAKPPEKPTTVGTRKTWNYIKHGTFDDAVKHFDEFNCQHVTKFHGGISGKTGTLGGYRFTVRDGSKQGHPTFEIRSPDGKEVIKIRFDI